MSEYTGRVIAVGTDAHGFYQPVKAIMDDIRAKGISEVYFLGDNIGVGPNPHEVMDILLSNNVICVAGNSEDYITLGYEPFYSYFNYDKAMHYDWTKAKLTPDEIKACAGFKHSLDLEVGGKKLGLVHFANDCRIDFSYNSTWSYQRAMAGGALNPNKQFYYTNSDKQTEEIEKKAKRSGEEYLGFKSALNERLFAGKQVDYYDEIIQGHVHFKYFTEDAFTKIRSIRAVGIGYGENDPIDFASYVIVREKTDGYEIEEVLVPYDRQLMLKAIENSDMPNNDLARNFTSKR